MSYKTLAKDIADDIKSDIQNGIIVTRSDLDRAVSESCDGSEVSFKPFAAKKYLEENGISFGQSNMCFIAYNNLSDRIYSELEDLDIDRILNQ